MMKNTVHLVVAGVLLSATCLQIPTFASDEGEDTHTTAVSTPEELMALIDASEE